MPRHDPDPQTVERLDDSWDARIAGAPAPFAHLDPTLGETVRRLHALDDAPAPSRRFVARLEDRLMQRSIPTPTSVSLPKHATALPLPSAPERMHRMHALPFRRWRSLTELAAVLLVLLAGGAIVYGSWLGNTASDSASAVNILVSDITGNELRRLDPDTFEDLPGEASVLGGSPESAATPTSRQGSRHQWGNVVASADGATVVRVGTVGGDPRGLDITVLDGNTGEERATFRHVTDMHGIYDPPLLSADGRHLLLFNQPGDLAAASGPLGWVVYETSTGRVVSTVLVGNPPYSRGGLYLFLVDPMGRWLVRFDLVDPSRLDDPPGTPSPLPDRGVPPQEVLQLVVQSLDTGDEIGRLLLDEFSYPPYPGDPDAPALVDPGFAFSPDGQQLAILGPTDDRLTLIDMDTIQIARTLTLRSDDATPAPSRLPATPDDRRPSLLSSLRTELAFSADGDTLYVARETAFSPASGTVRAKDIKRSLRLQSVALPSGTITADVDLGGATGIAPSYVGTDTSLWPDDDAIYLYGPSYDRQPLEGSPETTFWTLLRLDPDTFDILTERTFRGYRSVVLWHAPDDSP